MDIRTEQEVLVDAISGAGATDGASSTSTATAPMPGRVVRILVRPEDSVAAGDPLVIVEAMKMENELRSTVHGIVSRVAVTEGQTVDPGQVLCEIVPHVVSR
jgi:biotin carboxyl carrier protein